MRKIFCDGCGIEIFSSKPFIILDKKFKEHSTKDFCNECFDFLEAEIYNAWQKLVRNPDKHKQ